MPGEVKDNLFIDAFGVVHNWKASKGSKCDNRYMSKLNLVIDKETGSLSIDESEKIDLYELIQSYKDSCGMVALQTAIAKGVDPAQFADDGKGGIDTTQFADNINDAYRKALSSNDFVNKIAAELGLESTADFSTIEAAIKAKIADNTAKTTENGGEK